MENKKKMTPEMQKQYDMLVINGMSMIHDEKISNGILSRISESDDPIQAIAEITVDVLEKLVVSAQEQGVEIAQDVLVHGGNLLLGEIVTLAETAGMQKLTDEQKTAAYQLATSMFLDGGVTSGRISNEQLMSMGQQAKETPEGQKVMTEATKQGAPMDQGVLQGGM